MKWSDRGNLASHASAFLSLSLESGAIFGTVILKLWHICGFSTCDCWAVWWPGQWGASETLTNMRIRTRAEVKHAGSLLTDFMEAGSLTLALTSRREVVTRPCCVSRLLWQRYHTITFHRAPSSSSSSWPQRCPSASLSSVPLHRLPPHPAFTNPVVCSCTVVHHD